jgi:hypothetical protein
MLAISSGKYPNPQRPKLVENYNGFFGVLAVAGNQYRRTAHAVLPMVVARVCIADPPIYCAFGTEWIWFAVNVVCNTNALYRIRANLLAR